MENISINGIHIPSSIFELDDENSNSEISYKRGDMLPIIHTHLIIPPPHVVNRSLFDANDKMWVMYSNQC